MIAYLLHKIYAVFQLSSLYPQFFIDGRSVAPCITFQGTREKSASRGGAAVSMFPTGCAWVRSGGSGGWICSLELPEGELDVGVHEITAVLLSVGNSTTINSISMFLDSSSIIIRRYSMGDHYQEQEQLQFATPLYRSGMQPPAFSLVPHERVMHRDVYAESFEHVAANDDHEDISSSGAHDYAYSFLNGDPVTGGGMKVFLLGSCFIFLFYIFLL
jgi:hypothetical protein